VLGGGNTTYAARPCQFSTESDELMLSGATDDVGPQGENINFLLGGRADAAHGMTRTSGFILCILLTDLHRNTPDQIMHGFPVLSRAQSCKEAKINYAIRV
jgi:hypothetical protein